MVEKEPEMTQHNENLEVDLGKQSIIPKFLPKKDLFRVDEVMQFFDVSDSCIRNWLAHGILEKAKIGGVVRVTRESILNWYNKINRGSN